MSPTTPLIPVAQGAQALSDAADGVTDRAQALATADRAAQAFDDELARIGRRLGDFIGAAVIGRPSVHG